MRPPIQAAALQQNENATRHQHHHQSQNQQQQQNNPLQQQQSATTAVAATPTIVATNPTRRRTTIELPIQQKHKAKLQQHDILVENQLNFACSATAPTSATVAATTPQQQLLQPSVSLQRQPANNHQHSLINQIHQPSCTQVYRRNFARSRTQYSHDIYDISDYNNIYNGDASDEQNNRDQNRKDDSIQLVDLSTSPPASQNTVALTHNSEFTLRAPHAPTSNRRRSSIISSDYQYSRSSSSSEDGSLSCGEKLFSHQPSSVYSRASTFDDAAENFIINFPADSPSSSYNQNDCIINLPLSETEPLLTNIEATIADKKRSICLNKNSASLIFTKKEIVPIAHNNKTRYYLPTTATVTLNTSLSNNNCTTQQQHNKRLINNVGKSLTVPSLPPATITNSTTSNRRQHNSLKSFASNIEHSQRTIKSKHLPSSYNLQQRRSLQLNYNNNNLVTTSTCSANNNYCLSSGVGSNVASTGKSSPTSPTIGNSNCVALLHKHHHHHSVLTSPSGANTTTATATRKQHAYSWYAPVYSALEEELEQDSRDSSPIHNLANTKKHHPHHYQNRSNHNSSTTTDNETVALLETRNQINIQAQLHAQAVNNRGGQVQASRKSGISRQPPTSLALSKSNNGGGGIVSVGIGIGTGDYNGINALASNYDVEGPLAGSLGLAGGPLPRRRRFENFIKSLVGLKTSSGRNSSSSSNGFGSDATATEALTAAKPTATAIKQTQLPVPPASSPEIRITRTPSEQNVFMREPAGRCDQQSKKQSQQHLRSCEKLANGGSTSSLNVVHQKLWNIMRRESSAASLYQEKSQSIVQYTGGLRKCETVLALTRQTNSLCSPVLGAGPGIVGGGATLRPENAATDASNIYLRPLTHTGSGIFSASGVEQIRPLNRLRNSVTSINATCSRCSSLLSLAATGSRYSLNNSAAAAAAVPTANGGYINILPTSASSQQLLQMPQASQNMQRQQHLQQPHNSSIINSSGISNSSSSRSSSNKCHQNRCNRDDSDTTIDASGNCSRKSSAGATCSSNSASNSSTRSSSVSPPPSNVTTATLNSTSCTSSPPSQASTTSITPTSTIPTPPTSTSASYNMPTVSASAFAVATTITTATAITSTSAYMTTSSHLTDDLLAHPATSSIASTSSTSQAYPLTITSLLSMSSDEEQDGRNVANGITSISTTNTAAAAASTSMKHQQLQQQSATSATESAVRPFQMFTCKLCLIDVESASEATTLLLCGCQFCTECMRAYVEFEISEAAYEISCPDAQCPTQGIITLPEIANLTTVNLMKKHHRYRLNREIDLDKSRTWCPRAGCETVCLVGQAPQHSDDVNVNVVGAAAATAPSTSAASSANSTITTSPMGGDIGSAAVGHIIPYVCAVQCPSCNDEFCSACKKTWHPNISCDENSRRLVADGQDDIGIPFDNDLIKCCPMCAVPIEKDEGCAQMMCKRCKHVFCWYCLASLDDDFLLRHYDKGPCKNKLGHSRASVVWHRAQVIGIFAGFGILLLVASPLLLLAAPCIICCKCRSCSGSKIDEGDGDLDEATALQS